MPKVIAIKASTMTDIPPKFKFSNACILQSITVAKIMLEKNIKISIIKLSLPIIPE